GRRGRRRLRARRVEGDLPAAAAARDDALQPGVRVPDRDRVPRHPPGRPVRRAADGGAGMRPPVRDFLRELWTPAVLLALLVLVWFVGAVASPALQQVVTTGFVYLVVVVGLYTFIWLSGVVSFGHLAFMGIGAYVCALVSIPSLLKHVLLPSLPAWLERIELGTLGSILVGAGAALVFALIIAAPIMRISG